jgi:hypothetical protein
VGATGTTGIRSIQGLLDTGYKPNQLILTTRNSRKPKIRLFKKKNFQILEIDLEDKDCSTKLSRKLLKILKKNQSTLQGCYIHSTSSDTPQLDTLEVQRAKNLCRGLLTLQQSSQQPAVDRPLVVVYNSAAAPPNHGVQRIQQKHDVEHVFRDTMEKHYVTDNNQQVDDNSRSPSNNSLIFVSLRANIFMEEFWKHYTRPSILTGKYPLPTHWSTPIYLTSVRDMGRLAGLAIETKGEFLLGDNLKLHESSAPPSYVVVNVAGDYLRGPSIAKAFAVVQGTQCKHVNTYRMLMKQNVKVVFPDLYEQIMYIRNGHNEYTDIKGLREATIQGQKEGWRMTNFQEFLKETDWSNPSLKFEDLSSVDTFQT